MPPFAVCAAAITLISADVITRLTSILFAFRRHISGARPPLADPPASPPQITAELADMKRVKTLSLKKEPLKGS